MKKILGVATMLACLATPAVAQGKRGGPPEDKKTESSGPKVDDKAYKAALERIPEPKEKYDPWGGVAPAAAKKTK